MMRLASVLMIGLMAACSTEADTGTDSDAGSGTDAGTGTGTDGAGTDGAGADTDSLTPEEKDICACLVDGSCGAELCPSVGKSCDQDCSPDDPVSDEADLECALTALRDRTPGQIGWHMFDFNGQFGNSVGVYIRADGTAVVERYEAADLCSSRGPDTLQLLKEPAYYEGCLAMTTANDRLSCLRDGLGDETAVCAARMEDCSGV